MKLKVCHSNFNSILNCLMYSGASNQEEISLEDIMIFYSGTDKMSPLGFPHKSTLEFDDDNSVIHRLMIPIMQTLLMLKKYTLQNE